MRTYAGFFEAVGDPEKARRYYRTLASLFLFVRSLEMELVRHTHRSPAYTDSEILETVGLALEDFRTEEKGILFSHSSQSPVVQRLLKGFTEAIRQLREKAEGEGSRIPTSAVVDSLELMHAQIRFLMNRPDDNERTYLDFVLRQCPPSYFADGEDKGPDEPGRIILAR